MGVHKEAKPKIKSIKKKTIKNGNIVEELRWVNVNNGQEFEKVGNSFLPKIRKSKNHPVMKENIPDFDIFIQQNPIDDTPVVMAVLSGVIIVLFGFFCGFLVSRYCFYPPPSKNLKQKQKIYSQTLDSTCLVGN